MGRRGGRPSLNFSRFLAGKCVHVAPKKGPPFPDTRARNAEREDWATGIFLRAVGRQGIHLAGYTAQTREQEEDDREAGHVLIPSSNIIWNYETLCTRCGRNRAGARARTDNPFSNRH